MIGAMAAKVDICKFDGTKFLIWRLKMRAIFIKENCLDVIGTWPAKITDNKKWKRMDALAHSNLYLVYPMIFYQV